ncbi:MAG: sugar phosphate isomerase/epimerase [Acidobacteria bacterium]|nr:sugar phosphate isomerase/epimerase [Acidobacteriota bacterium]
MKRVLSTYLFVKRKLTSAMLADIAHAGIPAIELFCSRAHFDYRAPQEVRELADWLAGHNLTLHSVHAPTDRESSAARESGVPLSISDTERGRRQEAVDEIKRVLDLAEVIPFPFLVQHIASVREPMDPRKWDAAFSSLEHLMLFAKQRKVTIALENTPSEMASPANLRQFIHETRLQHLRLCFDTGHAHMEDGVAASFETMRELVVTTHVHDNRGEKDEHLLPYEGTIDWKAALKALGGSLPRVLELKDTATPGRTIEQVAAVFEKLGQAPRAKA